MSFYPTKWEWQGEWSKRRRKVRWTCTSQDVGFILWLLVSLVLFLPLYCSFHEHDSNKKIRDNIESILVSRVRTNVLHFHIPYTFPFEQVRCPLTFNKQRVQRDYHYLIFLATLQNWMQNHRVCATKWSKHWGYTLMTTL